MRIAVLGATGRMGTAVTRLVAMSQDCALTGAATEPAHAALGQDAGLLAGVRRLEVAVCDSPGAAVAQCDVAIDFTSPAAASRNISACVSRCCALVMGTTGLSDLQMTQLADAARSIPIVYGRNMSVGVLVMTELARLATKFLGPDADIEITETHHRHKVDAPSGTALQLGDAIAAERGVPLSDIAVYDRHATRAPRRPGSIGFSSIRAGNIVGDHDVLFALDEEVIELRHRSLDRSAFARGALRAAYWVMGRPAALYSMADVLGLSERSADREK